MASRRDELNAYSFARKRTNAAFLKPLPNGSIESAPKPLKAVVPSIVMGVLVLVGFGACGILKPVAPQGWDNVGENVIVGDKSTTRYVVLNHKDANGNDQKMLHPVLNLASARLLLDPDKFKVTPVKEEELDKAKIAHGPAVGIPFAPDRLPDKDDVAKPKTWAVCNRAGSGKGSKPQQAVFVLAGNDKKKIEESTGGRLDDDQALFVTNSEGKRFLVDQHGVKFEFDSTFGGQRPPGGKTKAAADEDIQRILFGDKPPQLVTDEWLNTLIKSPYPIYMPTIPGAGRQVQNDDLPAADNKVGNVVQDSSSGQKYVVTNDGVQKVSNFIAKFLTNGQNAKDVTKTDNELVVKSLATTSIRNVQKDEDTGQFEDYLGTPIPGSDFPNPWPKQEVDMANNFGESSQTGGVNHATDTGVSCTAYQGTNTKFPGTDKLGYPKGLPDMLTWVGDDYPVKISSGTHAYVTPGSGLVYRAVSSPTSNSGSTFLVTDTGLRYNVPTNNDSKNKAGNDKEEQGVAMYRLGYKGVRQPDILMVWSNLLSAGPSLDVHAAEKTQGS